MRLLGQCMVRAFSVIGILSVPLVAGDKKQIVKGEVFSMLCIGSGFIGEYLEITVTVGDGDAKLIAKHPINGGETRIIDSRYNGRLKINQNNVNIENIEIEDEGHYSCIDKGLESMDESLETELQVLVRPEISVGLSNPSLLSGNSMMEAADCKASNARPPATVEWTSDRHLAFNETKSENPGNDARLTTTNAVLSIVPTKYFDKQPFICTVKHPSLPMGFNSTVLYLDVKYSPSKPVIEVINQNTQLRCKAEGNPIPRISWTMPAGNPAPTETEGESVIRIISPDSSAHHNDTYICHASNGIEPDTSRNITTTEAIHYVEVLSTANTGMIIGIVIGCIVLIAVVAALFYWFCVRKMRETDTGPYPKKTVVKQTEDDSWSRSSGRPIIQHANTSLNKNAPPEPNRPPPDDDDDDEQSVSSHSYVGESTEGHDVEFQDSANSVDGEPTTGIISKNSVNFQPYWRNSFAEHRRKRPSTSPHRRSQNRNQPQPPPAAADPHYEVPPTGYYEDDYDEEGRLMQGHEEDVDDRFYDRPENRYPGYQTQPRYDEPPMDEQLPPYTDNLQYASLDHSYNPSKPRARPPYQEPVEYAEIRSHGQIV